MQIQQAMPRRPIESVDHLVDVALISANQVSDHGTGRCLPISLLGHQDFAGGTHTLVKVHPDVFRCVQGHA